MHRFLLHLFVPTLVRIVPVCAMAHLAKRNLEGELLTRRRDITCNNVPRPGSLAGLCSHSEIRGFPTVPEKRLGLGANDRTWTPLNMPGIHFMMT